jgi:hypothetical protein
MTGWLYPSSPRPAGASAITFPRGDFMPGWQHKGQVREFTSSGLYGHINGGSELFLEMGFTKLRLQKYVNAAGDEIALEAYRMDGAESALGIYLMNCGKETTIKDIPARNSCDDYQYMMLKGAYFLKVNNFNGKSSLRPAMTELANETLKQVAQTEASDLFSLLPGKNRVKGSELLIRGMYSLQSIYTLGEGDMLLLRNKIFGVTARYADGANSTYTVIIVRYPGHSYALEALAHIKTNLDSYIRVLEERSKGLTFKDYRGKFGIVSLRENTLHIYVNLEKKINI